MATQMHFVDELTKVMESLKSHKRFSLRSAAILSILLGSILNFVSLLVVFMDRRGGNEPKHITAWTSVALFLSFIWTCADLASHSDRIFKQKHLISVNFLVFMDGLGFVSFLALLIANGVVVTFMRRGATILMVYNSVPWMVCCAVHGAVAVRNLPSVVLSVDRGSTCCRECQRKVKRQETRGKDGGSQPLLEKGNGDGGYRDVEANATGDAV